MADQRNQNILKAQKKLNALYQGQKGFLESPENGYLTQASFVSLLTALQIEHKKAFPDFKPYSVSDLLKYWSIKPAMRHQLANALHDGQAMFNNTNTTQLMEIALGLHGESVDLDNRMLSGSAISDESQFAQDLGIDMEGWGMDSEHISFIAMLSPINVLLKNDSDKHNSIRRAQKALNKILSNLVNDQDPSTYSLNPVDPKKCKIKSKKFLFGQDDVWQENDILLNDTDGVSDQETFRSLQRAMQYFQIQDGYSDISFDEYVHNHFTMQFGDRDRIVWIGLALTGYLLINYDDFYDIPYEERQDAVEAYRNDYNLKTDHDFYEHLFVKRVKANHIPQSVTYIGTVNQRDGSISGMQSLYYNEKQDLYFDQLHDQNTANNLYNIGFDLNDLIHNLTYDQQGLLFDSTDFNKKHSDVYSGHTQTLFTINDHIITGCNYKQTGITEKYHWCQDFLIMNRENLDHYKIITNVFGVVKKLANTDHNLSYRTELAITPDQKQVVICPIDANGTQWFLLYSYQDIKDALDKISNGQALDLTKVDLKDSFSIAKFSSKHDQDFNKDLSVTHPVLDSIQGYTVDNDLNVYISSQKAPNVKDLLGEVKKDEPRIKDKALSVPKILKIGWNCADNRRKYYPELLEHDKDLYQQIMALKEDKDDQLPVAGEMEAVQYLQTKQILLVAITWHVVKYKSDKNKRNEALLRINWDEVKKDFNGNMLKAYLNQLVGLDLASVTDRIDLYTIKL